MTGATRQQRGVQTAVLSVRIPPELADWLREYARTEGISLNMAAAQVIEAGRAARLAIDLLSDQESQQ